MMMPKICAIVAMDEGRVIGINNQLPWKLPEDLKRFSALTTGHTVLMGRKTYQSLPSSFRPLPKRRNVVLSRGNRHQFGIPKEVDVYTSPEEFLRDCRAGTFAVPSGVVWVIGGAEVYKQTMPFWDEVFVTRIKGTHKGDAFFPEFEGQFALQEAEESERCTFQRYVRSCS